MDTRRLWSRREVLAGAAAAAAGSALAAAQYKPRIAAQFYVWTQNFQARGISIAAGVEEALAATRRAGYKRVQLTSDFFQGDARARTLDALKKNSLELPVVYGGATMHEDAAAQKSIADLLHLAETVRTAGTRILVTNPSPKPNRQQKTDAELEVQARAVNRLAGELKKRGMGLLLHHHDPEMAAGAREWRHLLHNTDPKLVSFCMDLHWVYRGGQDPLALLREAGPRTGDIHLRNSKKGVWTEDFGDGDIDYSQAARYLHQSGYSGFLTVELAYEKGTSPARPLEEDLRLSRAYTERVFGVKA